MPPDWVSEFIGVPYLKDGRTLDGADCIGLVTLAFRTCGRELPPYNGAGWTGLGKDREALGQDAMSFASNFTEIAAGKELPYDGVLLRMAGYPIHVGLVVCDGLMLHTERGCDSALESYRDHLRWANRIEGFFRFNGS
jgi:cell wall-associated NlpC family hydrolase